MGEDSAELTQARKNMDNNRRLQKIAELEALQVSVESAERGLEYVRKRLSEVNERPLSSFPGTPLTGSENSF